MFKQDMHTTPNAPHQQCFIHVLARGPLMDLPLGTRDSGAAVCLLIRC